MKGAKLGQKIAKAIIKQHVLQPLEAQCTPVLACLSTDFE